MKDLSQGFVQNLLEWLCLLVCACSSLACGSAPSAGDFPFAHPDTARALDRRISKERYEQRSQQLAARAPEDQEEWLARQLWAEGLPVWNRPGEFTVAHIPAIDRSKKDFVAIIVAESDAGLILEAVGAWTTAMRAKSLPRPPLLVRFVVCHEEKAPLGWLSPAEETHFQGALFLKTNDGGAAAAIVYQAPSSTLLDAVIAGSSSSSESDSDLVVLIDFDAARDEEDSLAAIARSVRGEFEFVSLQAPVDRAEELIGVALRTILQLRP